MKHKLAESPAEPGVDLGVFAHKLPRAIGIDPAPLPQSVLDWEEEQAGSTRTRKRRAPTPTSPSPSPITSVTSGLHEAKKAKKPPPPPPVMQPVDLPTVPAEGYATDYDKSKKKWFLTHPNLNVRLQLQCKGTLYSDGAGSDVWFGGVNTSPMYCEQLMEDFLKTQQTQQLKQGHQSSALAVKALKGMRGSEVRAPELPEEEVRLPARGLETYFHEDLNYPNQNYGCNKGSIKGYSLYP